MDFKMLINLIDVSFDVPLLFTAGLRVRNLTLFNWFGIHEDIVWKGWDIWILKEFINGLVIK